MNPNNKQHTIKIAQIITTVFLVLVLVVIVMFYLYYGIKIGSVENAGTVETEIPVENDESSTLDKYQQILDALPQSTSDISAEDKAAILDKMAKDSGLNEISDEEKAKVVESLQ